MCIRDSPLATTRQHIFVEHAKCADSCDIPGQDRKDADEGLPGNAETDGNVLIQNSQATAVDAAMKSIRAETIRELIRHFSGVRKAVPIISDPFAIYDIARRGEVDGRFVTRFQEPGGSDIEVTGNLLQEVLRAVTRIKKKMALVLQLDQTGSLHHYFSQGGEAKLGQYLLESRLVKHTSLPPTRSAIKKVIQGPNGRYVPFSLDQFDPKIVALLEPHLDTSIFNIEEIGVEPERVLRDFMVFEAARMEWEHPDDINIDEKGNRYHPEKNVFVLDSRGKMETKCLGVVAGLAVRLATRFKGANVQMFMEEDLKGLRVEDGVIQAGLRVFKERWLPENPDPTFSVKNQMTPITAPSVDLAG